MTSNVYQILMVDRDTNIVKAALTAVGISEKERVWREASNDIDNGKFYIAIRTGLRYKEGQELRG